MANTYSHYYSIVDRATGAPFTPGSEGEPFALYHLPEGFVDMNLLKAVTAEVRENFKVLGFNLEGSEDSPFV